MPGHSAGHVAFWRESDRVLILGDVLTNMDTTTGLPGLHEPKRYLHAGPRDQPPLGASASARSSPSLVLFGHGAPLRDTRKFVDFCAKLVRLIRPGRLSAVPDDRLEALEQRTRYEPGDVEPRVFERWERVGHLPPRARGDAAENFSIAVPPPNVTGALHMGHALNGVDPGRR